MKIGIIAAMSIERTRVVDVLSSRKEVECGRYRLDVGAIGGAEVAVMESGIGKVNAAIGAYALASGFKPDCIISTGVAGGLDARLSVMDVAAATETLYHDVDCGPGNEPGQVQGLPPRFKCDERLVKAALGLDVGVNIVGGVMASGDKFVSRAEDVAAIKNGFPDAIAVDMETCAIAQVCHILGVPFASFRIISDVPGKSTHYDEYADFWATMADKSFQVTRSFLERICQLPESVTFGRFLNCCK